MRAPAAGKDERVGALAVVDSADAGGAGEGQQLLKKGPWTAEEDKILKEYVRKHGEGNWNAVQKNSGLQRCGKSCRLRWANHLRPNLKKGSFSPEEEMLILQLHAEFGNKWARMAHHLPGRTDNEIKNYWNTRIKRRQRAGLPLYPVEIQQQMAVRGHRQGQAMPWMDNSPPTLNPYSQNSLSLFNSSSQMLSQNPFGSFLQDPNRGKNFSFQFPHSSASPATVFPNFQSSAQYGLGNFDLSLLPPPSQSPPSYSVKMELPSSQFFSGPRGEPMAPLPQGNSGLLDDLLLESHGVGDLLSFKCLSMDPSGKLAGSDCSIVGIQVKQEVKETRNQGTSSLLDMIPSQTAAPTTLLSDWYNNSNSGGEFSNGPSSEVTTDEDFGLEMHQLASTLSMAPGEHDWCLGSSSWDNMPSIC